jgi:hypothetical protein
MKIGNWIAGNYPESSRVISRKRLLSLLITVGVIIGLAGMFIYRGAVTDEPPPLPVNETTDPQPPPPDPPAVPPIDKQAVRAKALSAAEASLAKAEQDFADAAAKAADKHLTTIDNFFEQRTKGTKAFAEQLLSLKGKWKFVRGQIWTEEQQEHAAFIRSEFERHVFTTKDLNEVVASAIAGYVAEIQGLENQLLIQLRADISQSDLAAGEVLPAIGSQEKFDAEYSRLATSVTRLIARDLQTDVARELVSFIASDLAAKISVKMLTVVATKLGISSGIFSKGSQGAASSVATFGLTIAAAILVDLLIDEILKAAGNDPASQVAARVDSILFGLRDCIKDGIAEAKVDYEELRGLAASDPDAEVRAAAAEAADSIAKSGNLGLRRELLQIHQQRAIARREAVKLLILTEEEN